MRLRRKKYLPIYLIIIIILVCGSIVYSKKISKDKIKPLTMEEKLEDFEYLYNFIADNYPFLKVNERVNGFDWLGEKDKFKTAIENTTTDGTFIYEISSIVSKLNDPSTIVLPETYFPYYYSAYSDPQYGDEFKPWMDILNEENVLKRYGFSEKQLEQHEEQQTYNNDLSYCKTDIIIPNEVAYLKISQMNLEQIEKDGLIIRDFLEKVKSYDKLIIDIRGNKGGNDLYWMKNIIEPLANEDVSVENYMFIRNEYPKYFYKYQKNTFSPVGEIDKNILDSFPEEVKTDFKYYFIENKKLSPLNPVGFNGKIYLLVNEVVKSSSDTFAAFCKDSGFATLVGKTTGGDGIGMNTVLFSLPNSRVVVEFSGTLALNRDGTINQEVHTIPDIEIDPTIGSIYDRDNAIQYIIND